MSYKQNAASNRDALFGPATSGGSKKKKKAKAAISSSASKPKAPNSSSAVSTSMGYRYNSEKKAKTPMRPGLVGEERAKKLNEAEEYAQKAKKSMQSGLFSKPDPLTASTFYKRAADIYKLCGEVRKERFTRMDSASCQMMVGAYAMAAAEFTRAAELVEEEKGDTVERKREVMRKLHLDAAEAYQQMNEPAKAASSKIQAALVLVWGDDSRLLPTEAISALEEAVESFVPDPLNPHSRYRQTGISAFINPDNGETAEDPSPEALELANLQIVTQAYAHEPVQEIVYLMISFGEYAAALYAAGAVTTLLSRGGVATLTLSRAFVQETILNLAMGDPIAAEEHFLNRHVQKSSYLTSRECKLAEELFRAVKMRDEEELEEVRSPKGGNKAAIGNLHVSLRELVSMIRISGVARKGDASSDTKKEKKKKIPKETKPEVVKEETVSQAPLAELVSRPTGYEKDVEDADAIDASALQNEFDALDFGDDESSVDDDSIDLR